MKDTKRRLETFSFYDRTGLEQHLSRMAAKGWLLEKIGFFWTYRRIEPRTLTFSVCYFPKASEFDPEPSEEQQMFYDFCAHTGWTLAASSAQLQVFYNERPNPIPIETDPVMEVDAIHRSVKRSSMPSQLGLLGISVINEALFLWRLADDPIGVLSSAANLFTGACWLMTILLVAVEQGGYFLWRRRAVRAAQQGEFYQSRSHRPFQIGCLVVLTLGLIYYMASVFAAGDRTMIAVMLIMFCLVLPVMLLIGFGVKGFLKRRKASAVFNRTVTFLSIIAASLVLLGGITFGFIFGAGHGWFSKDGQSYQAFGTTFTVYEDELPLTIEDLRDTDDYDGGYSRTLRAERSMLLERTVLEQRPRYDAADYKEMPELASTIVLVKAPFLYDWCRASLLNPWDDDDYYKGRFTYVSVDAAPWGAVEAYQEHDAEFGPDNLYLLCYEDRLVVINFGYDWGEVTPEQMALVGEKLGGQ